MMNQDQSKIMTPIKIVKSNNKEKKRIRFYRKVNVKKIRSHSDYTFDERSSIWYTNEDYHSFKIMEIRQTLSRRTILSKKEEIQRARRIDAVRYLVLRAQEVQRNLIRNGLSGGKQSQCQSTTTPGVCNDYSQWLADFYQHHSEPCVIAALQRGVENDRSTIKMRREASSMLLKDSSIFKNLAVSNNDIAAGSKCDDRWSVVERRSTVHYYGSKRSSMVSTSNDDIPKPIKRSRHLQRILHQDFDLKKNNGSSKFKNRLEMTAAAGAATTTISSPIQTEHSQKLWSADITRDTTRNGN